MDEVVLIILVAVLGITAFAATQYYKQLRKATKEYQKAKGAVEDIILSVNRQFKNEENKLETVGYRVEASAARSEGAQKKTQELEGILKALESKVVDTLETSRATATQLGEIEKKTENFATVHEGLSKRIVEIEEQLKQPQLTLETQLEGVIPLKREKAMAQLTNTEVGVLEFLVAEGAKTAPEIKERVKLSREHTARLMKKLYEEGYLERETGKIPFRYSVKKEMEKLLKKTEAGTN
jgi:DNA-binding MarR family transcriptional regulator